MLLIFTKKYGKLSVGTGSNMRNNRSKSALATRPFTYGSYEIFKNRGYYNYNTGEVKKTFFSFGEDLDKYTAGSYVLELTEKILPEEIPEPSLFVTLLDFMETLEKRNKKPLTLILAYEIKMLNLLGTSPNMRSCSCCGKQGSHEFFSIRDGGMICRFCYEKEREKFAESKGIDKGSVKGIPLIYRANFDIVNIVEFFIKTPLPSFAGIALAEKEAVKLQEIVREYISFHHNIGTLKSESLISGF